jgi:hypothetical protein
MVDHWAARQANLGLRDVASGIHDQGQVDVRLDPEALRLGRIRWFDVCHQFPKRS